METVSSFGASTTSPNATSAAPTFQIRSNTSQTLLISDRKMNEPQTMEEEVTRLQVLQSYLILDSDREEAFERITSIASRVCNVPIALVSLVDIGRQWFLSNHGMGDVREMPRKNAFCAHVIQNKYNILIVPDATLDPRFKDNPLVTGAPYTRFYAGVPLISPEGHRLGSVCILSPDARPQGLSQAEQETLHDLSAMAVKALVERRIKLQSRDKQVLLQQTCADVTASLESIQHSLTSLCASPRVRKHFSKEHLHTMVTLVTASEGMGLNADMCRSTLKQIESKQKSSESNFVNLLDTIDDIPHPVTEMDTLINNLKIIMDPLPKKVPIVISVDEDMPAKITGDDLTLFRSAMSLLSNAVTRSRSESGKIHFLIGPTGDELCFECRDSGAEISPEERACLFTSEAADSSRLTSFAAMVRSMQGKYGYRLDPGSQSVFWFSVPFTMTEGSYGSVTTSTLSLAAKPSSGRPASQLALCGNAMCNTNVVSSA
jgi:hypothetical protein